MPPQAYSSGCSLRGPLTCATSIHRSPPCWLASPKRPTSSVLASNNRERSQTAQPLTSLCIEVSNGSSFLATHRGNGYALRACTRWWWWWSKNCYTTKRRISLSQCENGWEKKLSFESITENGESQSWCDDVRQTVPERWLSATGKARLLTNESCLSDQ